MNYQLIIAQLWVFLKGVYIKELPLVGNEATLYMQNTEKRLKALASNASQMTEDQIKQALSDEKAIFISEFKSFEIEGLAITQNVINEVESVVSPIFKLNEPTNSK